MDLLLRQEFAVAVGVCFSLVLNVLTAENPARVPFGRVWFKAIPGFILFFLFFFVVALPLSELSDLLLESRVPEKVQACSWLLLGLLVSQSPRLKDRHLSRSIAKKIPGAFSLIQYVDEISRLYLTRMYQREERRASFRWLKETPDGGWAVDQLFEIHAIDIARWLRRRLPEGRKRNCLTVFKIRHDQVKIKFVFRLLGLKEALNELRGLAETRQTLFQTWPPGEPDRRLHQEKADTSPCRRKYELRGVQAYVLGELDDDPDASD